MSLWRVISYGLFHLNRNWTHIHTLYLTLGVNVSSAGMCFSSPPFQKGTSFMFNVGKSFFNTQGIEHLPEELSRRERSLSPSQGISSFKSGLLPSPAYPPPAWHLEGRKCQGYRRCYSSRIVFCQLGVCPVRRCSAHPITRVTLWRSPMQSSSSYLPFRRDASKKKRNTIDR